MKETATDIPRSANGRSSLRHLAGLDGLRGCAILLVMVYHGAGTLLRGGFIGVDIFFVLSGYLITALLLKELSVFGGLDLKNFYARRILRLFPALLLIMAVFLLIALFRFNGPVLREKFVESGLVLFYAANWARAFDFFPMTTFGHAWSLSIEEQFYILWPPLLLLLSNGRAWRRRLTLTILILSGCAVAVRFYLALSGAAPDRIYNGLDTRADALLAGCLLAVLLSADISAKARLILEKTLPYAALLAAAGLGVASALFGWKDRSVFYWGFLALEAAAAVIIADIVLSRRSYLAGVLTFKPLVWTGTISYGLYLWHLPVYDLLARAGLAGLPKFAAGTVLTFAAAFLSYRLVEVPCLAIKKRRFNKSVTASSAASGPAA